MLSHRLIAATVSTVLLGTGVLGGVAGQAIAAQNAADLNARASISKTISISLATAEHTAGVQARATVEAFAPTIEAATALVEDSTGKASDASRTALSDLLTEIEVKSAARVATGAEARETATQIVATGTPALAAASQVVTDEVAAWQTAEDERIAAEQAAAEEAAREASRSNGGSGNSGSSGGSSNDSGGSNGNSDGRAWAEGIVYSIAPGVSQIVWDYTPLGGSYGGMHKSGVVYLSNSVADGSGYAYAILVHEATHAGPQRGSCYDVWKGRFGGDPERFTQAYTLAHFGTTVGAYAYPTQADRDAAGSC